MDTKGGAVATAWESLQAPMIAAAAVSVAGAIVVAFVELGPLARHMALHIASMNAAAPLAASAYRALRPASTPEAPSRLWLATFAQLGLLWAWHSPTLQDATHSSLVAGAALHAALFLTAFAFWLAVIDSIFARWEAIVALLVSGKLVCLLGALLIFAPRPLFEAMMHAPGSHDPHLGAASALADQQLAGLLMITACPLSFVVAAIVLAAQSIAELQRIRPNALPGRGIHGG